MVATSRWGSSTSFPRDPYQLPTSLHPRPLTPPFPKRRGFSLLPTLRRFKSYGGQQLLSPEPGIPMVAPSWVAPTVETKSCTSPLMLTTPTPSLPLWTYQPSSEAQDELQASQLPGILTVDVEGSTSSNNLSRRCSLIGSHPYNGGRTSS